MGLGRWFMIQILRKKWKEFQKSHPTEARIIKFILTRVFWLAAYLLKNFGIFVGIVEQLIKLLAGLFSLTPSREDDMLAGDVKELFNSWQDKIYSVAQRIVDFYNNIWKEVDKGGENE